MTDQEYDRLRAVVKAYAERKYVIKQQVDDYLQLAIEKRLLYVDVVAFKTPLINDLIESQERKEFMKAHDRAYKDPEFEKYFRAATSEFFHNRIIDPEAL